MFLSATGTANAAAPRSARASACPDAATVVARTVVLVESDALLLPLGEQLALDYLEAIEEKLDVGGTANVQPVPLPHA